MILYVAAQSTDVGLNDGHYSDEDAVMHVQVKITTDAPHQEDKDAFRFDLEVKAYNHLRKEGANVARFLVLYTMPADETSWLSQAHEGMLLRNCAYYLSLAGMPETPKANFDRIEEGMTLSEVEAVLGDLPELTNPREGQARGVWRGDDGFAIVDFADDDEMWVSMKRWRTEPLPLLDMVRRRLPWLPQGETP